MCGAKSVVDVDVTELRQRRTECVHVLLFCFNLQQFHETVSCNSFMKKLQSTQESTDLRQNDTVQDLSLK